MKSYEWFSVVEQGRHLFYFGEMETSYAYDES